MKNKMIRSIEVTGFVLSGLSALFVLGACSSANNGSDTSDEPTGTGGAFSQSGGSTSSSGGFVSQSGGFTSSSGGFVSQSGGFTSSGGDTSGGGTESGGAPSNTGGEPASGGGAGETGTGGTTGSGGTTGTGSTTGTGGTTSAPTGGPCLTDLTQQAAILGDSYVTGFTTPPLQPDLAMDDPSLTSTPNYAVAGVSFASGGGMPYVPAQFNSAIAAHPDIKFLIMDGGGNDILICDTLQFPGCNVDCGAPGSSTKSECLGIVDKTLSTMTTFIQTAAGKGVEDIVYFFYPHTPDNNGGENEILDYSEPKIKALCDGANAATNGKLSCFFVDLVQPFKMAFGDANPLDFETSLHIHPTAPGVTLMAQQIFNSMKSNCVGFTQADATKYGCTCTQ